MQRCARGHDSPAAIMNALTKLLGASGFSADHAFSCECHPKKQLWIRENFGSVERIFTDMHELAANTALELVSGCHQPVPDVDMAVAGCVCKECEPGEQPEGRSRALHPGGFWSHRFHVQGVA